LSAFLLSRSAPGVLLLYNLGEPAAWPGQHMARFRRTLNLHVVIWPVHGLPAAWPEQHMASVGQNLRWLHDLHSLECRDRSLCLLSC
jgi:hypothetical protein